MRRMVETVAKPVVKRGFSSSLKASPTPRVPITGNMAQPMPGWQSAKGNGPNTRWVGFAAAGTGAVVAGAALGYHETQADAHEPTFTSTTPVFGGIMGHAAPGLAGIGRDPRSEYNDPQRARVAQIEGGHHVTNVNIYCDEEGIPLSAKLADLFLLHHELAPTPGSPLDAAFEREIISVFKEEYEAGMDITDTLEVLDNDLSDFATATNQNRKFNTFNMLGVVAHTGFSTLKTVMYKIIEGIKHPPTERYSNKTNEDHFERYEDDVSMYREQIRESLRHIETRIEDNRENDFYKENDPQEHQDRNDLLKEQIQVFHSMPQHASGKSSSSTPKTAAELAGIKGFKSLRSDSERDSPDPSTSIEEKSVAKRSPT